MRLARVNGEAHLEGFMLAGDTSAQAWIKALLQEELPAQDYGRLLLSGGARAPAALQERGRQVCTCFNITDVQIEDHLAHWGGPPEARLAGLQGALRCGTNCGSCLPELRRMAQTQPSFAK